MMGVFAAAAVLGGAAAKKGLRRNKSGALGALRKDLVAIDGLRVFYLNFWWLQGKMG